MSDATTRSEADTGRGAALVVWILYLLSIPSASIFALIGAVVAYVSRDTATGVARTHLDAQLRIFWIALLWSLGLAVAGVLAAILTLVLIGFLFLWAIGVLWLVLMIWFTVKSILGLIRLLDGRPA